MSKLTIRTLKPSEIEQTGFLQPEGWDNIRLYFKFYSQNSFCYPIVAIKNGKIVGVANGIINQNTGWLNHIIVASDSQKQGIGYQLTENVITYLDKQGCKAQILIATKMGERLYKKFGFKTTCVYKFYQGVKLNIDSQNEHVRPVNPDDFENIMRLDKKISGEYRTHMIEKFLSNGWVYENLDSTEIEGYFLPELGEGLIIASNNKAGLKLLELKHNLKDCKAVIPDDNQEGQRFLRTKGFKEYNSAPRMVLGKETDWKPKLIFSRIGGFYG